MSCFLQWQLLGVFLDRSLLGHLGRFLFGHFGAFALARTGRGGYPGHFFLEFLDAAGRVNELFFARVERMAGTANFYAQRFAGGTRNERVAAGAGNSDVRVVFRMNVSFHSKKL